jgi:hypothetical protein
MRPNSGTWQCCTHPQKPLQFGMVSQLKNFENEFTGLSHGFCKTFKKQHCKGNILEEAKISFTVVLFGSSPSLQSACFGRLCLIATQREDSLRELRRDPQMTCTHGIWNTTDFFI